MAKIKLKNIEDLLQKTGKKPALGKSPPTPVKLARKSPVVPSSITPVNNNRTASTTQQANKLKTLANPSSFTASKSGRKNATSKKNKKLTPPQNQLRIDSFFKKSCAKADKSTVILTPPPPLVVVHTSIRKEHVAEASTSGILSRLRPRKRLFVDTQSPTDLPRPMTTAKAKIKPVISRVNEKTKSENTTSTVKDQPPPPASTPIEIIDLCLSDDDDDNDCRKKQKPAPVIKENAPTGGRRRKTPRPCPPYKIVEGTSFIVDGFQYGQVEGVTHYFLSHYHSDHYVGLTGKFAMPLYLSPITARLVLKFIKIDKQYLHELELQKPQVIDGVEVTAIDAHHCPGAIMLIFKLRTGLCLLHTGDFRACPEMESEPIFWNNDIDTIYLDTTYIACKNSFCTQYESIDEGKRLLREFRERHPNKRILYVCGAYVIGKEKFWSALAHEFDLKIWAESTRANALDVMQLPELEGLICSNPHEADLHIISMGKVNYMTLFEYFEPYLDAYDMLLAFRPSGWEKNSRPQYRGRINIVGVEYSEHSSHAEMRRFVEYLKPRTVISTVPVGGRDLMRTAQVPTKWYKYTKLTGLRNFQPSITNYLRPKTHNQQQSQPKSTTCSVVHDTDETYLDIGWISGFGDENINVASFSARGGKVLDY